MSMPPDKQLLLLVVLFGFLIFYQEYKFGDTTMRQVSKQFQRDVAWMLPNTKTKSTELGRARPVTPLKQQSLRSQIQQYQQQDQGDMSMSACLMVRDDNALLYEWLSYHYITLPLRHVLVAADQNSTEDPHLVLRRWDDTPLKYKVWNAHHFMHRFGDIPVGIDDQNHHYLHRQRAFFSSCAEYMKAQNKSWVVFIDTDEYIVVNRINRDDAPFLQEQMETNSTRYLRFQQRLHLGPVGSTAMDAIRTSNQIAPLDPCHVIPRLLIGALENETCPQMDHVKQHVIADQGFDVSKLSSVRFVQTAPKTTFYPSKWGKVMVDVSRLSAATLATKPKSSHRPFRECPKPLRAFEEAILHANHYLGSWERYSARSDVRRSRRAFEERAYFAHGMACEMHMEDWFPRFVEDFGVAKAKYLLGLTADR
jgi:hypothetical protein